MNKMTEEEWMDIALAHYRGEPVEFKLFDSVDWMVKEPNDPINCRSNLRIKPCKPSIDWSHVALKYKWLAITEDGTALLYSVQPVFIEKHQIFNAQSYAVYADAHLSFDAGNCDWKDSLVERPDDE